MQFSDLALSPELLQAIAEQGYVTPTPIQAQAIPVVLQGRDVMAGAQTGTGKTASFMLPLLKLLQEQPIPQKPRPVRVLILTPTRELCLQVYESARVYGRHLPLFAEAIFGGVSIKPQIQKLQRGTDIVVATPGRLLDLIQQGCLDLSHVQHFVLDEADRMLDMGFIRDMRRIIKLLPMRRQNLLFSATYGQEMLHLAGELLEDPVEIAVAKRNAAADTVEQWIYPLKREHKRELLSYLIGNGAWQQVLIFVRTKHGADRLVRQLVKDGIRSAALHGDKSQGARVRALEQFKQGEITALVATDIAARGLDIDQLPHVVNFDLPQVAEDYVHRIGRTGRAGRTGKAITFAEHRDRMKVRTIEALTDQRIPVAVVAGLEPKTPERPERGGRGEGRGFGGRSEGRGRSGSGGGGRGAFGGHGRSSAPRDFGGPRERDFGDRNERSERPVRESREFDDRPRSFNDRPRREGSAPRSFGDKPRSFEGGAGKPRTWGDKPRQGGEGSKSFAERKPWGDKPQGDRPNREGRSFDKPAGKSFSKPSGKSFAKPGAKPGGKVFSKHSGTGGHGGFSSRGR